MVRKEELLSEDITSDEKYRIALSFDPDDEPSPLFEYTFHLANLLNGEVVIVHALENIVSTHIEEEERKITTLIEKIVSSIQIAQGVPYSLEIIYGKDIENFVQFVEKRNINLFGFYYFKKIFGKTLSEQFIEVLTGCNLLVVKEDHRFKPIKKVLVPLDFSESSFKQKEFILRLKKFSPYPIEVIFLHVLDEEDIGQEEEIKLLFAELFDGLGNLKVAYGNPAKKIVEILKAEDYNLVVIGRTGKGLNLDFGKVTEEVIKEAPCPVVVV